MVSSQSEMIKESRTREGDKEIPTDSPETCSLSLSCAWSSLLMDVTAMQTCASKTSARLSSGKLAAAVASSFGGPLPSATHDAGLHNK